MTTYSIPLNSQKNVLADFTQDAIALAHVLGLAMDGTNLQKAQGRAARLWQDVLVKTPPIYQCGGGGQSCGWQ